MTTPNRLQHEKSPYLLQHAHNPVDWYPWGDEAFDKARSEDKPIFLSIGYSTCYWCHVMEREVFENPTIAEQLNRQFVSIKVDREERPDVDRIYMTALQSMSGAGGWPMSMFLTPDRRPFYGATYIPPVSQYGRPGFPDVLDQISDAWKNRRGEIEDVGERLRVHLRDMHTRFRGKNEPSGDSLHAAYATFKQSFDAEKGGFGAAPKFPRPAVLNFLVRYGARSKEANAMEMVVRTLEAMGTGGIHDHLGGGFHRYSTDAGWHVPHFEKMLYDQAQLVMSYLEAYQSTGTESFADIARDILWYVDEHLSSPEGGFYSAEDAESVVIGTDGTKKEGAFYVWAEPELRQVLSAEECSVFSAVYDIDGNGNVRHDPQGEFGGLNIPHVVASVQDVAEQLGMSVEVAWATLASARRKLLAERSKRPRPHLDDKIIASWNGLMISAYARAAMALRKPELLQSAARAAGFVSQRLIGDDGRVRRRYRDGESRFDGGLEDYACLAQAYLDMYEATGEVAHLDQARRLTTTAIDLFSDKEGEGFFDTVADESTLIARVKESSDGAEPSGNSTMALVLIRLSEMLHDDSMRALAGGIVRAFSAVLVEAPHAAPQMLVALDHYVGPSRQIVLAGTADDATYREMAEEVRSRFLPRTVVVYLDETDPKDTSLADVGFLSGLRPSDGSAVAYVCREFACDLPAKDLEVLRERLEE